MSKWLWYEVWKPSMLHHCHSSLTQVLTRIDVSKAIKWWIMRVFYCASGVYLKSVLPRTLQRSSGSGFGTELFSLPKRSASKCNTSNECTRKGKPNHWNSSKQRKVQTSSWCTCHTERQSQMCFREHGRGSCRVRVLPSWQVQKHKGAHFLWDGRHESKK